MKNRYQFIYMPLCCILTHHIPIIAINLHSHFIDEEIKMIFRDLNKVISGEPEIILLQKVFSPYIFSVCT